MIAKLTNVLFAVMLLASLAVHGLAALYFTLGQPPAVQFILPKRGYATVSLRQTQRKLPPELTEPLVAPRPSPLAVPEFERESPIRRAALELPPVQRPPEPELAQVTEPPPESQRAERRETVDEPPPKPLEKRTPSVDAKALVSEADSAASLANTGADVREAPQVLVNPAPPYPDDAWQRRQTGSVLLTVVVGADGVPISTRVKESSGVASLDNAAREFVQAKWRWKASPQEDADETHSCTVKLNFRFQRR